MATAVAAQELGRYERMVEAIQRAVGAEMLAKLRHPVILIDAQRRITYRNAGADALLERGDICYRHDDTLACRDRESNRQLAQALGKLRLAQVMGRGDGDAAPERIPLRLRRQDGTPVAATLLALRPEASAAANCQALFTLYQPGAGLELDPVMLSVAFDLTPAEARLVARLMTGRSAEQCAQELNVKMSTIRSQLHSVYGKTGATGQADLLRLVMAATAL